MSFMKVMKKEGVLILLVFILFLPGQLWGLTLENCIEEALKNSPYLLEVRSGWEAEKPRRLEEFSGFLPQLSLEYDLTRTATEDIFPYYQQYSGLSFEYNLFQGGGTLFSYMAARREVEAARAKYREAVVETSYRVTVAFYTVLEKKKLWDAAKDDLRDSQVNLDMAQARYKEGLAPYADVIKARAYVANSLFLMRGKESDYWVAIGKLNLEMGRPVSSSITLQGDLKEESWDVDFQAARQEAFSGSPLVLQAQKDLEGQRYRKNRIYSEFSPRIDFQWHYGWHDTAFPPNDYKEWSWQLTFTLPIFSGFASRARLARNRALVDSKMYRLDRVKLEVEQEVWKAYQELKKNQANVVSAHAHLKDATHDLNVSQGRYKEGLANMVDLTTAQANLSNARAQYISSLAALERSMAALEKAMGRVPYLERER
jgi:outer membrane protein TolC